MYENWGGPHNVKARPRFDKLFNNTPGNGLNFWRRPSFPSSRRNMMAGRYPNMGFRHRAPSIFEQNCSIPHENLQGMRYPKLNSPAGMLPPFVQRPSYSMGMHPYIFHNKNSQNTLPITNVNEKEVAFESGEQKIEGNEMNAFSDLWLEALAPGGRIYYYNTRTRESTWIKPINARIIELNEIKQLTVHPDDEKAEKFMENSNQNVPQQPIVNSYTNNTFHSTNFSIQPRIPLFPPNVFTPPPNFLRPPTENIQNNVENCNVRFMMSPAILNVPVIAHNLLPNNITNDFNVFVAQNLLSSNNNVIVYNSNIAQDLLPRNEIDLMRRSEEDLLSSNEAIDYNTNGIQNSSSNSKMSDHSIPSLQHLFTKNELVTYSSNDSDKDNTEISINDNKEIKLVNKKPKKIINNPQSNDSSSSFNSAEDNNIKDANENIVRKENEQSKIASILNTESRESVIVEENHSCVNRLITTESVDKSRPVSSTPIPGTHWCVVWTGDEKVFFHDSQRKISFWERPAELLNRRDVDKLVKRPPLPLTMKPLIKETRKKSSDNLDVTKKQKKHDEKGKNSGIKKTSKDTDNDITFVENNLEAEEKTVVETLSHDQKIEIFCEMLSENGISVSSTWKRDVHKIIFDSRYLLLPTEERKEIFNCYIKSKSQEEMIKREKEQQQKEAFLSLLVEAEVTSKSLFCDITQRYSKDERFKAIEDIEKKESIFKQYVSELENKHRESERLENELKIDFLELLSEKNCFDKKWAEIQNVLAHDDRYKAIHSDSLKENLFKEYIRGKCLNVSLSEKQKQICASVKHHEKGAKPDLSKYQSNRQKEEKHKYALAVSSFKELLDDLIEDSNIDWESATEILKADQRWNCSQDLEPEKCEELFYEHAKSKKKEKFRHFLDELPSITIKTSWLDIRKDVLKDPRCAKFSSCERECEKEFKKYLHCKQLREKIEFMQLLKETKWITDKSKSLLDSPNYLKDMEKALSQDKRYLNMDCMHSERKKILLDYIDKLHAKRSTTNNDLSKSMKKSK